MKRSCRFFVAVFFGLAFASIGAFDAQAIPVMFHRQSPDSYEFFIFGPAVDGPAAAWNFAVAGPSWRYEIRVETGPIGGVDNITVENTSQHLVAVAGHSPFEVAPNPDSSKLMTVLSASPWVEGLNQNDDFDVVPHPDADTDIFVLSLFWNASANLTDITDGLDLQSLFPPLPAELPTLPGAIAWMAHGIGMHCEPGISFAPSDDFSCPALTGAFTRPVPEPPTLLLLASGLLGMFGFRLRRNRR